MYLQFFGLNEAPFSITPDPAFVYLSPAHRDALAHLLYGVGKGGASGFVQLTGEVGTGKTTICRCLLEQVPADTIIALIVNPVLTPKELLAAICEELDIDVSGVRDSSKGLVDVLNSFLLQQHAEGRRVVVVIDEAQNLSPEALEQVRLLTNLETAKDKLLQMVLLGQPELRHLLQRQDLRQLAQRITARYHLAPLDENETLAYVRHRMQVAGAQQNPFTASAMRVLHARSGGVPRLINIIADRALAGAYARELTRITPRLVQAAADEVQPGESRVRSNSRPVVLFVSAVLVLAIVSLFMWGRPALDWLKGPAAADAPAPNSVPSGPALNAVGATPGQAFPGQPSTEPPAQDTRPLDPQASQSAGSPVAGLTAQPGAAPLSVASGSTGSVDLAAADEPAINAGEVVAAPLAPDPAWLEQQHGLAWWGLAELWQDSERAPAIEGACSGRPRTGYACLKEQGSWARVQRLGLPLILVLHDPGERFVVLRGLGDETVLLGAGDEPLEFRREAIDPLWLGGFIVVWPQAADWPVEVRRGDAGAAVDIVMGMAAKADPPWTGSGTFDANFESWLVAFQGQNGLIADGIVGPSTLLYLMAPTISDPRLVNMDDARD